MRQESITSIYEKGYTDAAKTQMDMFVARFNNGDFPYFYWSQPMVQEVQIPAQVTGGVFIPEHKEIVIIKPGEWMRNPAYPIEHQEIQNENSTNVVNSIDITPMPSKR